MHTVGDFWVLVGGICAKLELFGGTVAFHVGVHSKPRAIRDTICHEWGISIPQLWAIPDDTKLGPRAETEFVNLQSWWDGIKSIPPTT